MKRFAVFGDPIAHSLSPRIHSAFSKKTNIPLTYTAIHAPAATFEDQLAEFNRDGGIGANITLPLKSLVVPMCAELSDFAQRIGAVNTLSRRLDNHWRGDNTDGPGLIEDLVQRHHINLYGRRVLILGAGGAARAAAFALLETNIESLVISNRTPARAAALADALADPERVMTNTVADFRNEHAFDVVIDATSAGHSGAHHKLPAHLIAPNTVCYHLSYGKAARNFIAFARQAGATRVFDGLGMLVEQAAEAFAIWNDVRPETDAIYNELRAEAPLDASD
ncbi:MAG TPA: shikimate dehydrogenase [Rudaea sp.]|nr:shikimate dehydrogenase [Rudaea sp.]